MAKLPQSQPRWSQDFHLNSHLYWYCRLCKPDGVKPCGATRADVRHHLKEWCQQRENQTTRKPKPKQIKTMNSNAQKTTTNGKRGAIQEPLSVAPFLKTRVTNGRIPVNGNFSASGGVSISNSGTGGVSYSVFNESHRENNKENENHDSNKYNHQGNNAQNSSNAGNHRTISKHSNNCNNNNNGPNDTTRSNPNGLQSFSTGFFADSNCIFEILMELQNISNPFSFDIKTKTDLELWADAMEKGIQKIKNDEFDIALLEMALVEYEY